ncbi:hypothetical protein FHS18_000587 [Paenibacillus phyllosphaerae]|uniref:Uncharacterized protein n=1 Tax=Paenibacillus phyllosphaerae TaxID=274593 RepID=A0A7W5ATL9_9BACL|nr:hypothetical protein [Paenibacillus phyllosphaerae]
MSQFYYENNLQIDYNCYNIVGTNCIINNNKKDK